jgi:tRNA(Ile)-lysidine synthase
MPSLVKKIQNAAFQNGLWKKDSKIILGVSGGPDSVCMLDIMAKIAPKYGLKLMAAHVNYGLRGRDSDSDENFVKELAEELGVMVEVLNLKRRKRVGKGDSENRLREIRYEFFEKVREKNKFDLIAVGHNLDDQVETFLMRMIRGAGLQGLSAMKWKSGRLIRPLLGISRQEILEYLNRTDRAYRTDRTNLESKFLRNKIRNKLIPFLEKNFNPKIKKTIFGATMSIADDVDLMRELAEEVKEIEKGEVLSARKILKLHPALQRRVLLRKISEIKADLKDVEFSHTEEMLKALRSTKGKNQVVVFSGLKMVKKGDKVTISKLNN